MEKIAIILLTPPIVNMSWQSARASIVPVPARRLNDSKSNLIVQTSKMIEIYIFYK